MNVPEISHIFFTKHDQELAGELFLNYIKYKQSPKIMKFRVATAPTRHGPTSLTPPPPKV
jgi:hypothetical protein